MLKLILIIIFFVAIDIIVFIKLFRLFYKKKGSFDRDKEYLVTPDIFSLFSGNYWDHSAAQFKFIIFLFCCIIIIIAEILFLNRINLI